MYYYFIDKRGFLFKKRQCMLLHNSIKKELSEDEVADLLNSVYGLKCQVKDYKDKFEESFDINQKLCQDLEKQTKLYKALKKLTEQQRKKIILYKSIIKDFKFQLVKEKVFTKYGAVLERLGSE